MKIEMIKYFDRESLFFPIKIAANHRKKLLKLIQPMDPIFSNRTAVFFETERLWVNVIPKLQMQKQKSVREQTRLNRALGFLVNTKIARRRYAIELKKCI